ncbi:MAG: class I SAM-dependent methyltransferase [Alphaproteobacteria bacterium]
MTRCLLCASDGLARVLDGVADNRLGVPGTWDIRRCAACGLLQIDPVPAPADLIGLYAAHYNAGGNEAEWRARRDRIARSALYRLWLAIDGDIGFHLARGRGRLLDVGCNEGRGLARFRANGFDAEGVEPNPPAAAAARAQGFRVHDGEIGDVDPARRFDRIVLANVLEHTPDPRATLMAARARLAPDGELWLSLPNADSALRPVFGRHWINWHVPFHLVHFTPRRLGALLAETGFTPIELRTVTPALWLAQSVIARLWPGRIERLRRPALVAPIAAGARALTFPLLWWWNRRRRGDCIILRARAA